MYLSLSIVVCLQIIGSASSLSLPKYIVACTRTDPDFKRCAIEHGQAALPNILKGDKAYKMPSLIPLILPFVQINVGSTLSMNSTNLEVRGLEKVKLIDYNIDFDKLELAITLNVELLQLEGNGTFDGQILSLMLKGEGLSIIELDNGNYTYTTEWKLIKKKDGKEYMKIISDRIDFEVEKIHFTIGQSFFGNNELLSKEINKFLNENGKDIVEEVRSSVSETVAAVCRSIAGNLIESIPYDEMFLK